MNVNKKIKSKNFSAMAKKGGSKENIVCDLSLDSSVEQKMTSESNKQKIAKIYDIFPNATKDQIAKILQYYDDDENKALDALTRDGGSEALSNWAESGSLKSKNNKNKKKKKKGRKETELGSSATASFDADDSSSLHSSGNVDAEVEKECLMTGNRNGIHNSVTETKEASIERLDVLDTDVISSKDIPSKLDLHEVAKTSVPEESKSAAVEVNNPTCVSPISDTSEKHDDTNSRKDRYRSRDDGRGKHSSRQRTSSFRRSKTSSLSEDSTCTHNAQNAANPSKRGYDRCKKDLNRQTISLQRIYTHVDKGLEESSKKIKNAFNEIRKLLEKRQEQIEQELAKTKEDALNLLKSRQDYAVELKRRVDRAPSLTDTEWSELRSDIKQFVTERKYDDELGKTIWFQWSMDSITEIVNTFGEVHPVKNVYSQRSHSALSNTVASQNNPEPSPSSSLANEEIDSTDDKNDVANILDTVEDEVTTAKKEVPPPVTRNQPNENRARVFSNTKFQNNRSNRGFRGNRGYGYARPNNRNNMGYRNNYSYYEYSSDYRNHSHQERAHDNNVFSSDRNVNSHRNNRNERRGQNMNYRNSSRFRGNMNQRQSNDSVAKAEPVSNDMSAVNSENPNVMNGFVNN